MTNQFWYLHCTQFDFFFIMKIGFEKSVLSQTIVNYLYHGKNNFSKGRPDWVWENEKNQVVHIWTTSVTCNFLHAAPNCKKLKLYVARGGSMSTNIKIGAREEKSAKLVRQNWNTWKLKAAEHGVVTSFFYSTLSFEFHQIV